MSASYLCGRLWCFLCFLQQKPWQFLNVWKMRPLSLIVGLPLWNANIVLHIWRQASFNLFATDLNRASFWCFLPSKLLSFQQYFTLSLLKNKLRLFHAPEVRRSCWHHHVCFADTLLGRGWGCAYAGNQQLSVSRMRHIHATVSRFLFRQQEWVSQPFPSLKTVTFTC